MEKLTSKQNNVLDYLKQFLAKKGYPPTVREICAALNLSSPATVHAHLNTLEEKGYNPINQIVGYLLSGDPAYIPRLNDARNLIRQHERDEIIEELVRSYLKNNGETK